MRHSLRIRFAAVVASALMCIAAIVGSASSAAAHDPCTGTCNTIQTFYPVGIGIYDSVNDANWKWIQNGGTRSDGPNLYQRDVEGFYIGNRSGGYAWCFSVYQSNDNVTFAKWGTSRGPARFQTTYWAFNKVVVYSVPENDHC